MIDLRSYRCATCGARLVDGSYQPGIDPRFATGACRGACSPDESKIVDPSKLRGRGRTRVPAYRVCGETAGVRDRGTVQEEALPCLLASKHPGSHSPTFVPLTVGTRVAPQRKIKPDRKGERAEDAKGIRDPGRYTELIPEWGDGRPAAKGRTR